MNCCRASLQTDDLSKIRATYDEAILVIIHEPFQYTKSE